MNNDIPKQKHKIEPVARLAAFDILQAAHRAMFAELCMLKAAGKTPSDYRQRCDALLVATSHRVMTFPERLMSPRTHEFYIGKRRIKK